MSIRPRSSSATSSDEEPDSRVAKRARSSHSVSSSQCDFWFPDGDIVLAVDRLLFRVHKRVLSRSPIFHDMLGKFQQGCPYLSSSPVEGSPARGATADMPQPLDIECYDGVPLVRLYDDSANAWMSALHWLYNARVFYNSATSFEILSGSLRIATKYELPELREWCIARLASQWPRLELLPALPPPSPHSRPAPHAAAIVLARECDVPELLPAAFYCLSIEKWRESGDGGNAHQLLTPEDLRRIIIGREGLQALVATFDGVVGWVHGYHQDCEAKLEQRWWHARLGQCGLRELQEMVYEDVQGMCSEHLRVHRELSRERLGFVIAAIPSWFLI